jgi:hypothetical protein
LRQLGFRFGTLRRISGDRIPRGLCFCLIILTGDARSMQRAIDAMEGDLHPGIAQIAHRIQPIFHRIRKGFLKGQEGIIRRHWLAILPRETCQG